MAKARLDDPLTQEQLRAALHYDPQTGIFTWRWRATAMQRTNTWRAGKPAGCVRPDGYIKIVIDYRPYMAHRLAFLYMTGAWPVGEPDHKNGIPADNRWRNLRPATKSQNNANSKLRSNSTSGHKGIYWHKG